MFAAWNRAVIWKWFFFECPLSKSLFRIPLLLSSPSTLFLFPSHSLPPSSLPYLSFLPLSLLIFPLSFFPPLPPLSHPSLLSPLSTPFSPHSSSHFSSLSHLSQKSLSRAILNRPHIVCRTLNAPVWSVQTSLNVIRELNDLPGLVCILLPRGHNRSVLINLKIN